MPRDIPDIDIRIRAKLLHKKGTDALLRNLISFHDTTGISISSINLINANIPNPGTADTNIANAASTNPSTVNTNSTNIAATNIDVLWLKAILLVQDPEAFDCPRADHLELSLEERESLNLDRELEKSDEDPNRRWPIWQRNDWHKWKGLRWQQWKIVLLCAVGAATQGWAEMAINAAQTFYQAAFQIYFEAPENAPNNRTLGIVGLINGAPYLCCVLSCWLSPLLNKKLGRRGTIFWSTAFSIVFALLQGRAQSWWELFIYRLLMGIGIGPKSATIPVYVAETAPASIRGSLVMFWQVWTACGIMFGCLAGIAFQNAGDLPGTDNCPLDDTVKLLSWRCSQNWRYILASPGILPIFLFLYIYTCHESPRWTVQEAHRLYLNERYLAAQYQYQKAWRGLEALSRHPIIASRDMLSHYLLLEEERKQLVIRLEEHPKRSWLVHKFFELFKRRRNQRAILAASICMFAQQFCGVNLIVYYSNYVFMKIHPQESQGSIDDRLDVDTQALYYTTGFGAINFFLAVPAFFTIDTVGRRTLLLCTFPFLAVSHYITMVAFAVGGTIGPKVALAGMYLFGIFYSFGEGPVPFVYASESMPLYCREAAMAFVVSINWLFNWVIAFSGPWMFSGMKPIGTFAFYGTMCIVLWFLILFFVPETRLLRLEEIDYVFDRVKTRRFGKHAYRTLVWFVGQGKRPEGLYAVPKSETKEKGSSRVNGIKTNTEAIVTRIASRDVRASEDAIQQVPNSAA